MDVKKPRVAGFIGLAAACLLLVAGSAHARPEKRFDKKTQMCRVFTFDSLRAGYKTFNNSCKTCHTRENSAGAPFLYAESKTSNGWNRVFESRSAACAQQKAWDKLSQEELLKLNDFLYAYGFGSYDARTDCG